MLIPEELKRECVEAHEKGATAKEVYNEIFYPRHQTMSFLTFQRIIQKWRKKIFADRRTLDAGTFKDFTAHDATVRIDADGNIKEAWIKQSADDIDYSEILEAISENINPLEIETTPSASERMLEIPLFDMHFGIASIDAYSETLAEIVEIIRSYHYDEINIAFGQDMLHNNDFRGHTAKGTPIDNVDMRKAWSDAFSFWQTIISECIQHSNITKVIYSRGNHDECISWCLLKAIEQRFPQVIIDDSFRKRKAISWRKCFIGLTHGEESNNEKNIRQMFCIEFPNEFADARTREIHCGHLHREMERGDEYGILVRRMSTKKPTDGYEESNGYIGCHKRFMIFEWTEGKLKSIHYV